MATPSLVLLLSIFLPNLPNIAEGTNEKNCQLTFNGETFRTNCPETKSCYFHGVVTVSDGILTTMNKTCVDACNNDEDECTSSNDIEAVDRVPTYDIR